MCRFAAVVIAVLTTWVGPASAQPPPPPAPVVIEGPVRLEPGGGVPFEVEEVGRFAGILEVAVETERTVGVVNELPLEEYVAGIAEMPASWPAAALEAQAIAARTYALWEASRPHWGSAVTLRYDICATTQCQVYAGLDKADDPRWRAAVEATADLVLLDHRGGPVMARYHSMAGGRTRFNEDVFIGEGSYPWLVAVDTPEDAASPLARWRVVVPPDRLTRVLATTEEIRPRGTLTALAVRRPEEGSGSPTQVVIGGSGGDRVVRASTFARAFADAAEKMYPDQYPGDLPTLFPSSRYSLALTPEGMVVEGQGYGHGVGLSQYGARGLAEQGLSAVEILGRYYGGRQPSPSGWEGPIRVGVSEGRATVTINVPAGTRLLDARGSVVVDGLSGRMRFGRGPNGELVVLPTDGSVVTPWLGGLDISATHAEQSPLPAVSVVTSHPARLAAVVTGPATLEGPPVDAAPGRVTLPLPELPAGQWRIGVAGRPDLGTVPLAVSGREPPPPAARPRIDVPAEARRVPWALVAVAVLGVSGVVFLVAGRGRRHRR